MEKKSENQESARRFDLISIGELSRLTNVNIKSLRYYEKIGVLLPAYVNPDSGYRYYTYSQVQLVLSIQFYVDLGVPLHTLHQFISPSTGQINFADQISYGIAAARKRILDLQRQIEHANALMSEIERCETLLESKAPVQYQMPSKHCLVMPLTGPITEQNYYARLHQLLVFARKHGLNVHGETGVLCRMQAQQKECFVFSDIQSNTSLPLLSSDKIKELHLPQASYWCQCSPFTDISDDSVLSDKLSDDSRTGIFILTELFNRQFDYKELFFELRWSITSGPSFSFRHPAAPQSRGGHAPESDPGHSPEPETLHR